MGKKIKNLLCACLLALPSLMMCNGHICMQIGRNMGENGGFLPLLCLPHHNTPMYVQLLPFTAFLRA